MVVITGTGFVAGSTNVSFGSGHGATKITVNSPTSITTSPPSGSSATVDITVTTPGGTSFVGAADRFTYSPAPSITGVSPNTGSAAGGTAITITGTNFVAGATTVRFGTESASQVQVSTTSITAVAPAVANAGTVDITVSTPGGTTAANSVDAFVYTPVPIITGLGPAAGTPQGGTLVTIHGRNLSGATAVSFGSTPATSFAVVSGTEITAVAPKHRSGAVGVSVVTPLGTSPRSQADTFRYAGAPTATAERARPVAATQALLRAAVAPHGLTVTRCEFEYGRTTSYGGTIGCSLATTSAGIAVTAVASSLAPATEYHFRLVTGTAVGSGVSKDEHFKTPQLPSVAPLQVGLELRDVSRRPGLIGRLIGMTVLRGAAPGETIRVTCALDCAPHALLSLRIGSELATAGEIALAHPTLLATTTQIQVIGSAAGELSRYLLYAFSLTRSHIATRVVRSGCLTPAGAAVGCTARLR
jgi:hypothetical protein